MVSVQDSHSKPNITTTYPQTRSNYYYTPPPSSATINRPIGRSMRTIRSKIFHTPPLTDTNPNESDHLTDSFVDFQLGELANKSSSGNSKNLSSSDFGEILDVSHAFSDFSTDISGELHFLASVSGPEPNHFSVTGPGPEPEPEPCSGFLQRESFSTEIIDSISPEDLQPTVKLCVDGLNSLSVAVKRSAAAKLRLLGKNRADNRALIGECGAVPALVPLLCSSDSFTQEHAVTALLNLSLHERNKSLIMDAGAVKSIVYVLKTGTEVSKQNAACALLSLALMDDNKSSIGACGAIKPLVALLINGSDRGKKDALTTLYKLCTVRLNKERAVGAGAVRPLVGLVGEQGSGLAEKAIVVLSSLAGIGMGRDAVVEEGGIAALVEVIEDGSDKGKEFAVLTLMQLCGECVRNRGLLVSEGGIPLLVALSQTGTAKSKHKAEALLVHLRESREEAYSSIS